MSAARVVTQGSMSHEGSVGVTWSVAVLNNSVLFGRQAVETPTPRQWSSFVRLRCGCSGPSDYPGQGTM